LVGFDGSEGGPEKILEEATDALEPELTVDGRCRWPAEE